MHNNYCKKYLNKLNVTHVQNLRNLLDECIPETQ